MRFQDLIDKNKVPEIRDLIDPCAFRVTQIYYDDPETEIEDVLILDESLDLAEVGTFFTLSDPFQPRLLEATVELIGTGKIKNCYHDKRTNHFDIEQYTFAEIPPDRMVYVIQAPPFYLVKLTDKVWR